MLLVFCISDFFRISHRAEPEPRHRVHRGKDKLVQLSVPSVSELCVLCGEKLIDKVYEGVPKLFVLLHSRSGSSKPPRITRIPRIKRDTERKLQRCNATHPLGDRLIFRIFLLSAILRAIRGFY
jgi:hypothetical protein